MDDFNGITTIMLLTKSQDYCILQAFDLKYFRNLQELHHVNDIIRNINKIHKVSSMCKDFK